jgi:hypothetical protein
MTNQFLLGAIAELQAEAQRLDEAIASLERLPHRGPGRPPNWERELRLRVAWENRPERRGRKPDTMSAVEKQEVSARMKKYWAKRRAHVDQGHGGVYKNCRLCHCDPLKSAPDL